MSDLARLDEATDYRRLLEIMWPELPRKGEGDEVYMVPPSRPDEKIGEMRFSVNVKRGLWKDHKTGEQGNMLTLCKTNGPQDWRARWREAFPATVAFFGGEAQVTHSEPEGIDLESFVAGNSETAAATSMFGAAMPSVRPAATPVAAKATETMAQQMTDAVRASLGEVIQKFAEAWHVKVDTLLKLGVAGVRFQRGRLAGVPQLWLPMHNGEASVVGIKARGLIPVFQAGDKLLKSKNIQGGQSGLCPFPPYAKPRAILTEGEKDMAITTEFFTDYDVIGNLGGASTFKAEWAAALAKYEEVIILYDNDEAGMRGTSKVAAALRIAGAKKIRCAYLPKDGQKKDLWDFLTAEGGKAMVETAIANAVDDKQAVREIVKAKVDSSLVDLFKASFEEEDDASTAAQIMLEEATRRGLGVYKDSMGLLIVADKKLIPVGSGVPAWNNFVHDYMTGLDAHGNKGRQAAAAVRDRLAEIAKPVKGVSWASYKDGAWYMLIDYHNSRVVKVTSKDITVVANGDDGQIFRDTGYPPINILPDTEYNHARAEELWERMWSNLNCTPEWQKVCSALFRGLLLRPLLQTHPHIRFQGPAGCGKSTGSQMLAALMTGSYRSVSGDLTQAAAARIAAVRPFMLLDDIENRDMKFQPWLNKMFLRAATGASRELVNMEAGQTDDFPINSWIVSNGIFSIAEDTPALNERLFVIPMLEDRPRTLNAMAEFRLIEANRDLIWNYLFREVQRCMPLVEQGFHEVIKQQLPREKRYRLHETYAVLSLVLGGETQVHPHVEAILADASAGERKAIVEASNLTTAFRTLPGWLGTSDRPGHPNAASWRSDRRVRTKYDGSTYVIECTLEVLHAIMLQVKRDTGQTYWVSSTNALVQEVKALRKVSEEYGITFEGMGVKSLNGARNRWWRIIIALDRLEDAVEDQAALPMREPGDDEEVPF